MVSWRQPFSGRSDAAVATASNDAEFSDGSLKYVGETGGNSTAVTYQEATGAPVENESPLGYDVGPFTIVLINVTMMIGTGIYSTRMFNPSTNQVILLTTLSLCHLARYWFGWSYVHILDFGLFGKEFVIYSDQELDLILFPQLCIASGAVYLEFTAYFPSRSGSEVVFLEQAFPRPTWFFPTTFAVQSVLLSFGSSNAVGKYDSSTLSSHQD